MTKKIDKPVLVLVGPTAIGKTSLSIQIAQKFSCEVVSVDSMQIYRHMDIGTAKITENEMAGIPHYLIDIVDPDEDYDAAKFSVDALNAIEKIHGKGKVPLLTGGTGLYLKALLHGIFSDVKKDDKLRSKLQERLETEGRSQLYLELCAIDPVAAGRIHENDTHRLLRALEIYYATGRNWTAHVEEQQQRKPQNEFLNLLCIGLTTDREQLYRRIDDRSRLMIESGFEKEVRELLGKGYHQELKSMKSIGYRHMIQFIHGKWSRTEMLDYLARDTRRYAKRQYTWFSSEKKLKWFEVSRKEQVIESIAQWLN